MKPKAVIEVNIYAEQAARVRTLLKSRAEGEAEIAKIMRKWRDDLGVEGWLARCKKEFGWARRTAYRHLNPEQMEKDREEGRERMRQCAEVRHIEEPADDDREEKPEPRRSTPRKETEPPANYLTAYMLRADTAKQLADCLDLINHFPVTKEAVASARRAAAAWTALAQQLEKML